jgi:hypothetical protein
VQEGYPLEQEAAGVVDALLVGSPVLQAVIAVEKRIFIA